MFTGIVTEVGKVIAIADKGDKRVTVSCAMDPARIAIGASIACSGVCLTVVEKGGVVGEAWFAVDVSGETISRTAPAQWQAGAPINLEPALRLGDELGGHIVTGHVDALGTVVSLAPEGGSLRVIVAALPELAPYIAPKGSITVDGVSLTVNAVEDQADRSCHFALNIIPTPPRSPRSAPWPKAAR
jgi:riboflavin synthase